MTINCTKIGAILAALGIGLGAFGAHALQEMLLEKNLLDTYKTAVLYHLIHAIGLVALGRMSHSKWSVRGAWLLVLGTLGFSGSLYLYCFTGIRALNFITPLGGLLLIIGWLLIALGGKKESRS